MALDAHTGVLLWDSPTNASLPSAPVVANGVVYVGSDDVTQGDNLYAFDARTGARLWSYVTGIVFSSCAVANGVVYVGSEDQNIYAFGLSDSSQTTQLPAQRPDLKTLQLDFSLKVSRFTVP